MMGQDLLLTRDGSLLPLSPLQEQKGQASRVLEGSQGT